MGRIKATTNFQLPLVVTAPNHPSTISCCLTLIKGMKCKGADLTRLWDFFWVAPEKHFYKVQYLDSSIIWNWKTCSFWEIVQNKLAVQQVSVTISFHPEKFPRHDKWQPNQEFVLDKKSVTVVRSWNTHQVVPTFWGQFENDNRHSSCFVCRRAFVGALSLLKSSTIPLILEWSFSMMVASVQQITCM